MGEKGDFIWTKLKNTECEEKDWKTETNFESSVYGFDQTSSSTQTSLTVLQAKWMIICFTLKLLLFPIQKIQFLHRICSR